MPSFQVLLTDYAWADLDIERRILAEIDAELIVADKQDAESLAAAPPVDAIMTNWAKVPQAVIAAAPKCQLVSRLGIGLDNIDVAYCTSAKIPVTNVPDYCLIEVAEHALAQLLSLLAQDRLLSSRNAKRALSTAKRPAAATHGRSNARHHRTRKHRS